MYLHDEKKGLHHQETVARLLDPAPPPAPVDWNSGAATLTAERLAHQPVGEGAYLPPPAHLAQASHFTAWQKGFSEYLYRQVRLTVWHNPALKLYGQMGESQRDFRARCEKEIQARREAEAQKARSAIDKKMQAVQQKLRREQRELTADQAKLEGRQREELLSYGESALNLLSGRRSSSMITSASRKRRLSQQAKADVEESIQVIAELEKQLADLAAEWEEQAAAINARWAEALDEINEVAIAPRRQDVVVNFLGLAWAPMWQVETKDGNQLALAAYETGENV